MLWDDKWSVLTLVVLAIVTELIEPFVSHLELFSVTYVGVLATALSIFLVFRFNEAYERWWEARTLWGTLVNSSRDFGRQVLTLLRPEEVGDRSVRLLSRQVAFANTLRIRLREGDAEAAYAQYEVELRRLLPDEADELLKLQNIPNAILVRQSEEIAGLLSGSTGDRVLLARFDDTFNRLHDVQGACERIKTTAFPDTVALVTRFLVWGLVTLLLIATVEPSGRGGLIATISVCIMSMGFIWIESLTRDLKDPFENTANDTPMTSLCVVIERDLREMLGDTDLPEPVKPVRGVLM